MTSPVPEDVNSKPGRKVTAFAALSGVSSSGLAALAGQRPEQVMGAGLVVIFLVFAGQIAAAWIDNVTTVTARLDRAEARAEARVAAARAEVEGQLVELRRQLADAQDRIRVLERRLANLGGQAIAAEIITASDLAHLLNGHDS